MPTCNRYLELVLVLATAGMTGALAASCATGSDSLDSDDGNSGTTSGSANGGAGGDGGASASVSSSNSASVSGSNSSTASSTASSSSQASAVVASSATTSASTGAGCTPPAGDCDDVLCFLGCIGCGMAGCCQNNACVCIPLTDECIDPGAGGAGGAGGAPGVGGGGGTGGI